MPKKGAGSALPRYAREHLAQSGIARKAIQQLHLRWLRAEEVMTVLKLRRVPRHGGILFPYFDVSGKLLGDCRVRVLPDPATGWVDDPDANLPKYLQPAGSAPRAYFPPLVDWKSLLDKETTLIITEGEKKSIAGCLAGIPTIGLGGVWSFAHRNAGQQLLPDLAQFRWIRRRVYVAYDSDLHTNRHVRAAAMQLAQRLGTRGAEIRLIPFEDDVDGRKVGLDDYLVEHGVDALQKLMDSAPILTPEREAMLEFLSRFILVTDMSAAWDKQSAMLRARRKMHDAFPDQFVDTLTANGRPQRALKAEMWWQDPSKRTAKKLVLKPDEPEITADGDLNTFMGWGTTPRPGPIEPWLKLLHGVFQGNQKQIDWFEQWLAYPLQYPGTKLQTAVFVYGGQGVGKTAVGQIILDIYGNGKSGRLIQDREIFYGFNGWIASTLFALGDDLAFEERRKSRSILKSLIASEHIEINEKYIPTYSIVNRCNFYFTANSPAALPLDPGGLNRRFVVVEGPETRPYPKGWYTGEFNRWRWQKGGPAFVHDRLKKLSLKGFEPYADAPDSEAKNLVVEASRSNVEAWVMHVREHCPYDLATPQQLYVLYQTITGDKRTGLGTFTATLRHAATPLGQHRYGEKIISLWALRDVDHWRNAKPRERVRKFREERAHMED